MDGLESILSQCGFLDDKHNTLVYEKNDDDWRKGDIDLP